MKSTFENPFGSYNAAKMSPKDISNLWCDPLPYLDTSIIINDVFLKAIDPIIIIGGRGCGKTMFLRYWSSRVIIENSKNSQKELLKEIVHNGGTSIYIRIEGSKLNEFDGDLLSQDQWNSLFTHFFELNVGIGFLNFLVKLSLRCDCINHKQITEGLSKLLKPSSEFKSLEDAKLYLEDNLNSLDSYRTNLPFTNNKLGDVLYPSAFLSKGIPNLIRSNVPEFKNHRFFVTLDEYENFKLYQQRILNTYIKFADSTLSYRISMRPRGFKTFDTVNEEDFIKEGSDYSEIVFDRFNPKARNRKYKQFLRDICLKRLINSAIYQIIQLNKIETILGSEEDLDLEVQNIVEDNNDKLFDKFLKKEITPKERKALMNRNNPIMEMLNIHWVNRGYEVPDIVSAMKAFNNKTEARYIKKYKLDYSNKYRYSLVLLIASAFSSKKKQFYSFNTFTYLSSNNARFFINLCATAFQEAYFKYSTDFISILPIEPSIQHVAAYINAKNELQEASKIFRYGSMINRFIINLGNTFKKWQEDPNITYPETNQFTVDESTLPIDIKKAFQSCLQWSIILEKGNLQKGNPSKPLNQIYSLNKIYCPLFSISYRTRGGFNISIDSDQMTALFTGTNYIIPLPRKKVQEVRYTPPTLFDENE